MVVDLGEGYVKRPRRKHALNRPIFGSGWRDEETDSPDARIGQEPVQRLLHQALLAHGIVGQDIVQDRIEVEHAGGKAGDFPFFSVDHGGDGIPAKDNHDAGYPAARGNRCEIKPRIERAAASEQGLNKIG